MAEPIELPSLANAIGRGVHPERDQDFGISGRVARFADKGFDRGVERREVELLDKGPDRASDVVFGQQGIKVAEHYLDLVAHRLVETSLVTASGRAGRRCRRRLPCRHLGCQHFGDKTLLSHRAPPTEHRPAVYAAKPLSTRDNDRPPARLLYHIEEVNDH